MSRTRSWKRDDLPKPLLDAIDLALPLRARAPVVLRVTEIAGYTDWVLILSGRSDRNVRAIADAIRQGLAAQGRRIVGQDGIESGQWALLDYDDFIIHVFYHPVRRFYDLESMWNDAPSVPLDLPDEVMDTEELDRLETPVLRPPLVDTRGDIATFGGFEDEFDDNGDLDEYADEDDLDWDQDLPDDDEASPEDRKAAHVARTPAPRARSEDERTRESDEDDDLFD